MNLLLGQPSWTRVFREAGGHCAAIKDLRDKQRKFNTRLNRIQVFDHRNDEEVTSEWKIAGAKIGINTDEEGRVYVEVVDESPAAGQATVNLYKAAGRGAGDKVATGSAADNGTVTLAATNSSGMTGSVKLGVVAASDNDDKHQLYIFPDYPSRATVIWDGSVAEDAESKGRFLDACQLVESNLRSSVEVMVDALRDWIQNRFANLMKSGQATAITSTAADDGTGQVDTVHAGVIEDARLNMSHETSPSAQTIRENAVSAGAGVFDDTNNAGRGSMAAPTVEEWAPDGVITFICDDDTLGSERFTAQLVETGTGLKFSPLDDNSLQVKKNWSDPLLGVRIALLNRTLAFDASDAANFATAADYTINGETINNTSDGSLFMKMTGSAGAWVIEFYKAATMNSDTLVGITPAAAANAIVGINQQKGSGLSGIAKIGSAPVAGSTRTLKLQVFKKKNASGVPDRFQVTVTVASRGEFADAFAKAFRYRLNSAAAAETIPEGLVRAGTFMPYSVRDV